MLEFPCTGEGLDIWPWRSAERRTVAGRGPGTPSKEKSSTATTPAWTATASASTIDEP